MITTNLMNNGSKPAYPQYVKSHGPDVVEQITDGGLTKREHFAAMAMQGILAGIPQRQQDMIPLMEYYAKQFPDKSINQCVAIESVEMADALLKQLGE